MKTRAIKPIRTLAALTVLCLFLTGAAASAEVRTWTDDHGRAFQGELVRVDGLDAVLALDGKEYRFPLANLSAEDKLFVFRWRRAQLPTPVATPGATPGPTPFFNQPAAAPSGADAAFNAYNAAFLSKEKGRTFYKKSTTKSESTGTWVLAIEIQMAEDVYERTHSGAHRQLVSDLLTQLHRQGRHRLEGGHLERRHCLDDCRMRARLRDHPQPRAAQDGRDPVENGLRAGLGRHLRRRDLGRDERESFPSAP